MLHPAIITPLNQTDFSIPPNSTGYGTNKSMTVPARTLWGLAPHMHVLGQTTNIQATAPDGTTSCLLNIPSWDFHWQQLYFYSNPSGISLAANTKITLTCTWNNPGTSAVKFGEATTDEMCLTYFYVTQ